MRILTLIVLVVLGGAALPTEASALWSRARIMSATPAELALSPTGATGQAMSPPSISADGRYVAFATSVRNLFVGDEEALRETANGGILRREVDGIALDVVAPGPPLTQPGNVSIGEQPAISADGRFVAFTSTVALVAADDDGTATDVYVRDMSIPRTAPGAYDLISEGGEPGARFALTEGHGRAAMSADGRHVLFTEVASTGRSVPLVLLDRATRQRMTVTDTAAPSGFSGAALSADGRTVAWVDGDPRTRIGPDAYLPGELPLGGMPVRDPSLPTSNADLLWMRLAEGRPRRVTGSGDGENPACPAGAVLPPDPPPTGPQPPRGPCDGPFAQGTLNENDTLPGFESIRLSADGRKVAWVSPRPWRGGPPDVLGAKDLFLRDMELPGGRRATTRELTRFTALTDGVLAATLDETGTAAALTTSTRSWPLPVPTFIGASLPPTRAQFADVYAMDLTAGIVERVTSGYDGTPASAASEAVDLTPGGTRAALRSAASNLIFGDANGIDDTFVADRFQESSGSLPQQPFTGASGGVVARVFPVWRLSVTVSRGGRVLYVYARVPGAGTIRATARSRTKQRGRRTQPVVAATTGQARDAGTIRLRLKLRTKYLSAGRRGAGLPVRITVRFTPRRPAGQRSVTTLERVRVSTFRVPKAKKTKQNRAKKRTMRSAGGRR
ncbi:MAG: PD40 domain-containing protein [Solirubrobacteraceae bacterium]|nr:PD40 domain-containing protein [Solirubrobacteraceae bacterium]